LVACADARLEAPRLRAGRDDGGVVIALSRAIEPLPDPPRTAPLVRRLAT
jgi:hypothetical protein